LPNLQLANISKGAKSQEVEKCDFGTIAQWAFPNFTVDKKGVPPQNIVSDYERILNEFQPDIIQVWGSENPLKLLPFLSSFPAAKVLTMQGVLSSITAKSLIGLSLKDIFKTIGLRELITRQNIYFTAKSFDKDAVLENEMIKKSDFIITQSDWTDAQIKHLNKKATYFRVNRELREEFLKLNQKWTDVNHLNPIIYSAAVGYTLKGLHVLIRAMAIVKEYIPEVELRLAGATGRHDWLGDGYLKFILNDIKKFGLEKNIVWLGAVSAKEIVTNLLEASVFVNPSFVESYSMVVAESMAVGTPAVISFAGAMPELAEPNKEALFFSPGDHNQLAQCIIKLLQNTDVSNAMSREAQKKSSLRTEKLDNAVEQYKIYQLIMEQLR
jgi:glycosyltransferase involved in cell wall biosynthesis